MRAQLQEKMGARLEESPTLAIVYLPRALAWLRMAVWWVTSPIHAFLRKLATNLHPPVASWET